MKNYFDKNKLKEYISLIVGIITTFLLLIGASFAYFQAQIQEGNKTTAEIKTGTTDNLTFSITDIDVSDAQVKDEHNPTKNSNNTEIVINANQDNFGQNAKNLGDGVKVSANLLANDATNESQAQYNLFFVIEENDFEYTTETEEPEIILSVTDPLGKPVEDIKGLKKVEGGFDITKRKNATFLIASDYDIKANPNTTQDWQVKVTLVNLPTSQHQNAGKRLKGQVYITTEDKPSYELPKVNNSSVEKTYNTIEFRPTVDEGTERVAKYYYGIEKSQTEGIALMSAETVKYEETTEPSYTFEGLKANTEYTIYSYVEDESGMKSNVYETEITTNEYKEPIINKVTFERELYTIKAIVDAKGQDGEIETYHYYKDGELIASIPEAEYTYEGLSDTSSYDLKIEVEDNNHVKSTAYEETISTLEYIYPEVESVDVTDQKWNSVTLTTNVKKSTNDVTEYKYQVEKKDGTVVREWFVGTKNQVIENLEANQEYNVKIKVKDSIGRESKQEYIQVISTSEYNYIQIKVSPTITTDSIKLDVSATPGDGTITKYMYSKNGGDSWEEFEETTETHSYTFSELTSDTEFPIWVKVIDSNNKESNIYKETLTTKYIEPTAQSVILSEINGTNVTATLNVTKGSREFQTYYFKVNDGESFTSSASNSYSFEVAKTGDIKVEAYAIDSKEHTTNHVTTSYINPKASKIEVTEIVSENSLTVTTTAAKGTGNIKTYYFRIDEEEWQKVESSEASASLTFENINKNDAFNVSSYVEDENNRNSNNVLTGVRQVTVLFNANGNIIEREKVSCFIKSGEESCTVTTPIISKNNNTPDIIGYSLQAEDHSKVIGSGEELTVTREDDGKTYYAQTKKDAVTRKVKFDPNGNTSFTYNSTKQTAATEFDLCTIAATYNGAAQATSCKQTITFPTIEASGNTPTVIGWSIATGTHTKSYSSGQAGVELTASSDLVFYAQTQSTEKTYTATFMPQNAGSTLVNDISGNNNHGKVYGNPKYTAEGLVLDGEEDWVDAGLANQNFGKAFSVVVRFKIPVNPTRIGYIIGNAESAGMYLRLTSAKKISYSIHNGSGYQEQTSPTVLNLNTWYELTLTFDGTNIRLYINGKLDSTKTISSVNMKVSNMQFHIGNNPNPFQFQEQADSFIISKSSIYNKVLSQAEITNSYNGQTISGSLVSYDFTANRNKTASCKIDVTYNGVAQATSCEVTAPSVSVRDGYDFLGWNTNANAQTASITNGGKGSISGNTNIYMITKKDITITYNANKASGVGRASDTCTLWNATDSCSKTAPSITAPTATPTVLGWNTLSNLNASVWNVNATRNLAETLTYYAQTRHDAVTRKITFDPNGNTSFTYGNDSAQTKAKAYNLCTIAATYNGTAQATSCKQTITFPTIEASANTPTVIGWSTATGTHTKSYSSGQAGVELTASSDLVYYAQTQSTEKTYTATFIPQNAGSTLVNDISGNNNHGKVYGNPKYSADGLTLDGEEDWVDVGLAKKDFGKAFSVVVKLKIPSTPTRSGYIIGNAEGAGMYLQLNTSNKLIAGIHNGSGYQAQTSNTALNLNTWYEIAVTFDGTNIRLYINGKLDSTKTISSVNMKVSNMQFILGHNPNPNNTFDSQLKEIVAKTSIYNKVLSQDEITNSYNGQTISGALVSYDFTANRNKTASCKISVTYNGVAQATSCEVTAPTITTRDGYDFLGWNTNANAQTASITNGGKGSISDNTNIYMITKKDITITYNANKASGVGRASDTCTLWNATDSCSKTAPSITAPTATPTVLGWGTAGSLNYSVWNVNATRNLAETLIYYAQTTAPALTRTIAYSKGANVSATGKANDSCKIAATYNGTTQTKSCNVTLPSITPASGYLVDGYYEGTTRKGNVGASIAIEGNVTYTANVGTITFALNSANASQMKVTATVSPASTPLTGYQYSTDNSNWTTSSTTNTNTFSVNATSNYTLYVKVTDKQNNMVTKSVSYTNPSVGTVKISNQSWGKLDAGTTGTKGSADITKYCFSINDGNTYPYCSQNTGTSETMTITPLDPSTTYKIKAYVEDKNGRKSEPSATVNGVTTTYTYPTVKINSSSVTQNSVTINYTGTNGTGTITKYRIYVNNSQIDEISGNSGTLNYIYSKGVTAATSYKIKIQAVDNNVKSNGENFTSAFSNEITAVTQYQQDYAYKGSSEKFVAPATGTYRLEVWGAQGGAGTTSGGMGGYSYGNIKLNKNDVLYITVGGEGPIASSSTTYCTGGYNGGGQANCGAGAGGGATHIATASGTLASLSSNTSSVIIVAGGGGGGGTYQPQNLGGSGGGLSGTRGYSYNDGFNDNGGGGTQTAGGTAGANYVRGTDGKFGQGGNGGYQADYYNGAGAGGGGYYGGGGGSNRNAGGGGGSGYLSSKLISGTAETFNGIQSGAGKARIVFMDTTGTIPESPYEKTQALTKAQSDAKSDTLLYHNEKLANSANDYSYRYSGASANVNNYVCLDDKTSGTCADDNLYRIIGFFPNEEHQYEMKLQRKSSLGNYYWSGSNSNSSNVWANSTFNTVTLNQTYYNSFSDTVKNMIVFHNWKVGGTNQPQILNSYTPQAYVNEVLNTTNGTTNNSRIALMYASDYGYAAYPSAWTAKVLSQYNDANIIANNWMYANMEELLLTRHSGTVDQVFQITSRGDVQHYYTTTLYINVRPVFYLNSKTTIKYGNGTTSSPFRLSINPNDIIKTQ